MAAPPPSYSDSTDKKPGYPPNTGYNAAPYPASSAPYPQPGYSAPYPPAQPQPGYNNTYNAYPGAQPPATGFAEPKPAPMPSAGHHGYSGESFVLDFLVHSSVFSHNFNI